MEARPVAEAENLVGAVDAQTGFTGYGGKGPIATHRSRLVGIETPKAPRARTKTQATRVVEANRRRKKAQSSGIGAADKK